MLWAYVNRGAAWVNMKDYGKAIADYKEAILLDPKNALGYRNRGWVWDEKKEYDKAIADYNEAIRTRSQGRVDAYRVRGYAWSEKMEFDRANADFDKANRLTASPTVIPPFFTCLSHSTSQQAGHKSDRK